MEEIMVFRKACKNWLLVNPPPLVELGADWRDQIMTFGFGATKIRKQGNEHSLRGLAVEFSTRINVIVVTTSGHHIQQYNPPENIQYLQELWLIYMDLKKYASLFIHYPGYDPQYPPSSFPTRIGQERCKRKSDKVSTSDGFFGVD